MPGITLGEAQYATPMADIGITGDKLTFESLNFFGGSSDNKLIAQSVLDFLNANAFRNNGDMTTCIMCSREQGHSCGNCAANTDVVEKNKKSA